MNETNLKELEEFAASIIGRLTEVVGQSKETAKLYEGGIEGIKLLIGELRNKINGTTNPSSGNTTDTKDGSGLSS